MVPPLPIPNRAVKRTSAYDTWTSFPGTMGRGRRIRMQKENRRKAVFSWRKSSKHTLAKQKKTRLPDEFFFLPKMKLFLINPGVYPLPRCFAGLQSVFPV